MRLAVLVLSLSAVLSAPLSAQPFDTPEALLEAFYEPYLSGEFTDDESVFRSAALNQLYADDARNTPEGDQGAISFDPYIDGQDFEITKLEIGEATIKGDKAEVEVSFDNFDRPTTIIYDLVREEDSWKIDDVAKTAGEYPYRLSDIFEEAKQYW
jgi:hypothetical protein